LAFAVTQIISQTDNHERYIVIAMFAGVFKCKTFIDNNLSDLPKLVALRAQLKNALYYVFL
jgi:hypothetical protein